MTRRFVTRREKRKHVRKVAHKIRSEMFRDRFGPVRVPPLPLLQAAAAFQRRMKL